MIEVFGYWVLALLFAPWVAYLTGKLFVVGCLRALVREQSHFLGEAFHGRKTEASREGVGEAHG